MDNNKFSALMVGHREDPACFAQDMGRIRSCSGEGGRSHTLSSTRC